MMRIDLKRIAAMVTIMLALTVPTAPTAHAQAPEGYITHELTGFVVSLPAEFIKSDGWSSETSISLNSDELLLWDDGDEYSSSATINVYDFEGNINDLNEYAQNMLWSVKALDETCDEPIVEGNTVMLRSTSELDDGVMINWRFIVVNDDGKIAGGTISYRGEEAKYYEGIVEPIIHSITFK